MLANRLNKIQLNTILLGLISASIPIYKRLTTILIIIYTINYLFLMPWKEKLVFLKQNRTILLILTLFYILQVISFAYSNNKSASLFDLEVKFSLLLFPVLFFSLPKLKQPHLNLVLKSFIIGLLISSIYSLVKSFMSYLSSGNLISFFYVNLSHHFHPAYYAMYFNFGVIILLHFYQQKIFILKKSLFAFLIFYFSFFVFLLNSKIGIISLILTYILFFMNIGYHKKQFKKYLFLSLSIILLSFIIVLFIPQISTRFSPTIELLKNQKYDNNSTFARIGSWKSSLIIIRDNLIIGVGNGDVKDELIKTYQALELEFHFEKKFNSHNQFLQAGISTGILGIMALLLLVGYIFYPGIKNKVFILWMFGVMIILNFLTESLLETQAGVVFFAFFNTLLIRHFDLFNFKHNEAE